MGKNFFALFFGVLLVFGFTLLGCDTEPDETTEEGDTKRLSITGINFSGDVTVLFTTEVNNQGAAVLVRNDDNSGTGVGGTATISNGNVSIPLKIVQFSTAGKPSLSENDWDGNGQYFIWLWNSNNVNFSGSPPYSAPISALWTEKISFSSKTTIVPWNRFAVSPE